MDVGTSHSKTLHPYCVSGVQLIPRVRKKETQKRKVKKGKGGIHKGRKEKGKKKNHRELREKERKGWEEEKKKKIKEGMTEGRK